MRHPALTAGERYYLVTSGLEMDPPQIQPARSLGSYIQAYWGSGSEPYGWVLDGDLALKAQQSTSLLSFSSFFSL